MSINNDAVTIKDDQRILVIKPHLVCSLEEFKAHEGCPRSTNIVMPSFTHMIEMPIEEVARKLGFTIGSV